MCSSATKPTRKRICRLLQIGKIGIPIGIGAGGGIGPIAGPLAITILSYVEPTSTIHTFSPSSRWLLTKLQMPKQRIGPLYQILAKKYLTSEKFIHICFVAG